MQTETPSPAVLSLIARAYSSYASLMRLAAPSDQQIEPNLGGRFLYAGGLEESVHPLIAAANIAGAATLVLSDEQSVLRQAQRDGLIDFLVNSLDEALRIFKNEIRKRQPVAVAVFGPTKTIEAEMLERGVLPDLLPALESSNQSELFAAFRAQGAEEISPREISTRDQLCIWRVPAEYLPQPVAFDAILAEHLAPGDQLNRRWLRLSPRYLGTAGRRLRSIVCDPQSTAKLIARVGKPLETSFQ